MRADGAGPRGVSSWMVNGVAALAECRLDYDNGYEDRPTLLRGIDRGTRDHGNEHDYEYEGQ